MVSRKSQNKHVYGHSLILVIRSPLKTRRLVIATINDCAIKITHANQNRYTAYVYDRKLVALHSTRTVIFPLPE